MVRPASPSRSAKACARSAPEDEPCSAATSAICSRPRPRRWSISMLMAAWLSMVTATVPAPAAHRSNCTMGLICAAALMAAPEAAAVTGTTIRPSTFPLTRVSISRASISGVFAASETTSTPPSARTRRDRASMSCTK